MARHTPSHPSVARDYSALGKRGCSARRTQNHRRGRDQDTLIDTSGMFVEIEDQKDLDSMVQAAFQSGKALKVESVLTHGGTVRS